MSSDRRLRRWRADQWWSIATWVLLLIAWEIAGRLAGDGVLPPPSATLRAVAEWGRGTLASDLSSSVGRVLIGFLAGTAVAIPLGAATAIMPVARMCATPVIELLRPIPPIAWIPLAILWFGVGVRAAVFIVALGAFFPVFTATHLAIASVRRQFIDTARCLGAPNRLLLTDVLLPASAPQIIGGLRTGMGVAWMTLIAAELIGAQSGLGYMIQLNRLMLRTDHVVAGMLVIALAGVIIISAINALERRLTPWNTDTLRSSQTKVHNARPERSA